MGETITEHVSLVGAALTALAVAFIAVLAFSFKMRRSRRAVAPVSVMAPEGLATPPEPSQAPELEVARESKPITESQPAVAPESEAPQLLETEVTLDGSALDAAVQEAESSGEAHRLPSLYFSLAQQRRKAGDPSEAAELLRKCIRAAAAAPHKDVHAKARLALGDIAFADGDPTTACEHWQIARAIFHEVGNKRDHAEAEQRMLSNGCPTDWVLTDF